MRTYRDLWVTAVTLLGVLCGLSVIAGWNWPVLDGSVRWGIVAVGAVSLVACASSGWVTEDPRVWYRSPWIILGAVIGTAVLALGVIGLFTNAMAYLVLMVAGTILLWLVSTLHHFLAAAGGPARRVTTA